MKSSKVDRNKGKPYNTSCVHGKSDKFRLVEVLRNFASLESVNCADENQNHVVNLIKEKKTSMSSEIFDRHRRFRW